MELERLGVWTYRLETWAQCHCPEPGRVQRLGTSVQLSAATRRRRTFDQAGLVETNAAKALADALETLCPKCGAARREVPPPADAHLYEERSEP